MAYNKYTINNLAQGTVNTILTAGSTTLVLSTGQGALFPTTFPFILKLEGLTTGNVVRREIVKCTGRTGDTLTIVRSFETCPANYTAVNLTSTDFQFEVGDIVSLIITKESILDIQNEVTRLETDKLNKNGTLRTGLGNYKVIYTDDLGVEKELQLGVNGTFLASNGETELPSFKFPTVASATETSEGVVERANDAEAIAGIDTTRYITPKQARDNYYMIYTNGTGTMLSQTSITTTVFNHSHGKIPRKIKFTVSLGGVFQGTGVLSGGVSVFTSVNGSIGLNGNGYIHYTSSQFNISISNVTSTQFTLTTPNNSSSTYTYFFLYEME